MSALEEARARAGAWYAGLEPREQLIVRTGSVAAAVLLAVGLVLQLHSAVSRAEKRLGDARADLAYLQSVQAELRATPVPQGGGQSLVTIIDRTTKDSGLGVNLKGADPSGTSAVRVHFEGASFTQLVQWLVRLGREYGLAVQQATLEKTDAPGRVNANLMLVSG